jgi:hypothetical protein
MRSHQTHAAAEGLLGTPAFYSAVADYTADWDTSYPESALPWPFLLLRDKLLDMKQIYSLFTTASFHILSSSSSTDILPFSTL